MGFVVIGIQQLLLHMPQFVGQVHMDGVGIDQAAGLIPEGIQFLLAVSLDLHHLGGAVDASALLKYRD